MTLAQTAMAQTELKTPPIAQLVLELQSGSGSPGSLPSQINVAFDASLYRGWFAPPRNDLAPTGTDDTIHLARELSHRILQDDPAHSLAYRNAWRTLCHRVFELRVPTPPPAHLAAHVDYPTAKKQTEFIQIFTVTLEQTEGVWLALDLGSADDLATLEKAINVARELRDIATTANDRQKLGDIPDAYTAAIVLADKLNTRV